MIFNILILDDEKIVCNSIKRILEDSEKSVFTANIVSEAEDILKNKSIDLLLLDYKLGEEDGISVLENIKDKFPDLTVIMITAYGNIDIAVKAMKLGVYDFIQKKEDPTFIRFTIQRTLDNLRLKKEVDNLKAAFNKNACMPRIIAVSKSMTEILELAREFAKSDSTVLIEGETGTGKNLLAEYIHFHSPRFDQAFIPINCAAIPAELIESELFGYEKGAFTGAHQQGKQGLIERANNGTLLLDEIGELSPKLQTKLLHILEKNEIFRLGSVQPIKVNVRFIAATNSNLMKMVKQKKFRADLFYRLNVASFEIPPIRKRSEDIIPLAKYIIDHFNRKYSKSITHLTTETENFLKSAKWQGNVRELSNSIERAMLLKKDSTLSLNDLNSNNFKLSEQTETGKISSAFSFNLNIESGVNMLQEAQKQLIDKALKITEQNISKAAQLLGVPRTSLNFYINKHDLSKKQ